MSLVRPFPARLVRQDHAERLVTATSDSPDEASAAALRSAADPAAYDEVPAALYGYRQVRDGVPHTAIVCEVAIQAFADGRVRGHEAVQPQRVEGLVRQHATTGERPALVALLHHAGPAFTAALEAACGTPPLLDFAGPGGLPQAVWRIADDTGAVAAELAAADLYVADGHHRVAAALEEWRLGGRPDVAGLLCVVHPMDGLHLSAFDRRVTGPVEPADLLSLLSRGFEVSSAAGSPAPEPGTIGVYVAGSWCAVRRRPADDHGPLLDVEVLQALVFDRLPELGPGAAPTVEVAAARTSVAELTRRCDADGGALFTLAPPPLSALTGLADAGKVMPPKTTYFEPKPCTGIFLRPAER
ncbi:DUF1015 family protein [Nocardioides donggukensis]|uniref:DUF1015 family protein n=1 Tax=Nocardioides donggukensis TaxID=2774019 RepID=A0A927K6E0_9ACTN|nr:DUF1015 family protein [Nocardioides donggukensis]MBD8871162.1 DUF1015 family protein [Nocardioides donggukensis]